MKLMEITSTPDGSYAGVRFSKGTHDAVADFNKSNNIPNALATNKMHTTLLYSRKHLPEYTPAGMYESPMVGKPTGFEKWPSQPDDDGNVAMCLVLRFDCPELSERHRSLMDEHEATYDYDEYKPHITLSYDVAGLQCKDLPSFDGEIEIIEEYGEDLNLSWANDHG